MVQLEEKETLKVKWIKMHLAFIDFHFGSYLLNFSLDTYRNTYEKKKISKSEIIFIK